jgi:hypothetical protein
MRSVGVALLATFIAFSVASSGCATIMAGGPDHVPVATNPPGATVFVDNMPVGTTPMVVTLNREHSNGVIRIELAGFAPVTVVRAKNINGWFWVNFCFGGVIGIIVDLVTGDIKAFDDTPITLGLTPGYGPPAGPPVPYPPQPGYPPPQPGYPPPQPGYPPPPPGYPPPPTALPPAPPPR